MKKLMLGQIEILNNADKQMLKMQTQQLQQNKNTLIIKVSKENVLIKFPVDFV